MSGVTTILHAGEDFVLHHHRGRGKYLLVTFMHSHQEHTADTEYLLRSFAERHEIPCLGIACRTRHFYNSPEIERVLAAAAAITASFDTVVVIGNSIGGYAALKYSGRLRATHVLAIAPPWSLDLQALQYDDPEQRRRLAADLAAHGVSEHALVGMAIHREELSGRVVVVHNPLDKIDNHQLDHLQRALHLEETFPLQQQGHNVFPMLERANVIARIIDLLRFAGPAELRAEFRSFRRSMPGCVVPMLQQAVWRHPLLVHRALRGPAITRSPQLAGTDSGRTSNMVAFQLARAGHIALAQERIERMAQRGLGKAIRITLGRQPDGSDVQTAGAECLLLSVHGTILCATTDASPRLALSEDPFGSDTLMPVFARLQDDRVVLRTMLHGGTVSAPLALDGVRSWICDVGSNGTVALHAEHRFLLATPDDNVLRGAPTAFWESFMPIGVPEPGSLLRPRSTDWLALSANRSLAASTPAEPARRTQPARRAGGLATLFGLFGRQVQS